MVHCTVKPVLVATSVKQAACIKQACIYVPKKDKYIETYLYKASTCLRQAHFYYASGACFIQVGLYFEISVFVISKDYFFLLQVGYFRLTGVFLAFKYYDFQDLVPVVMSADITSARIWCFMQGIL